MYAVIEESGGQRKVAEGDEILIDLYKGGESEPGEAVTFDRVLLLAGDGPAKIGRPLIEGSSVSGEVIEPLVKGDKLDVYKFRRRKGYKRKTGHRQRYTAVRITSIKG